MAYQTVRNPKSPTTTPKLTRTPGPINRKIVDYVTKSGKVLYEQATRSLYSDSEGEFSLTSEGHLPFIGLITGHMKLCVWLIFDVDISTTGSIKEILGCYGEITLSDINRSHGIIWKQHCQF